MPSEKNPIADLALQMERFDHRTRLREALEDADIPASAKREIRAAFRDADTLDGLEEAIAAAQSAVQESAQPAIGPRPGVPVRDPVGQERTHAQVGDGPAEKIAAGLDGFFSGQNEKTPGGVLIERFGSLKEAYSAYTGKAYNNSACYRELATYPYDSRVRGYTGQNWRESLQVSSWPQALGDSIYRRALAEYYSPDLTIWRQVVSEIGTVSDYGLQRRIRAGYYGPLSIVPEGGVYPPVSSPKDEEASFTPIKRGGIESITMESLMKDAAIGMIRRIPERLGRAAGQAIHDDVFNLFANNANVAFTGPGGTDTGVLFSAGHNNLLNAVPLSVDGLSQAVVKLASQTAFGDLNSPARPLGLTPAILLITLPLWATALQLTGTTSGQPGTADNSVNPFLRFGLQVIQPSTWVSGTTWYVLCRPSQCPGIEVDFLEGQGQAPEIFTSSAENQDGGAMWNADKISYKVRFQYAVGLLEYRFAVGSR